jgi:hypothetical protein
MMGRVRLFAPDMTLEECVMNVPWFRPVTVCLSICAYPAQASFHLS